MTELSKTYIKNI